MNYINFICYESLATKQMIAITHILLNAGVSVRYLTKPVPEGEFFIRFQDGWIFVSRKQNGTEGECVYMHPERVDPNTMDVGTVRHIQLPLKEIMAMGMEDKGAYQAKTSFVKHPDGYIVRKETIEHRFFPNGYTITIFPDGSESESIDPTDLSYLMKRLRFDANQPAEADDGEIVSVEDVVEPKKDE